MQSSTFEFEAATSLVNFVGQKKTKYYSILKRIELDERKYIGKQLKLNL